MTYTEIIKANHIELVQLQKGKVFTDIFGKNVRHHQIRTVLYYGMNGWSGTRVFEANMDNLFFHLVRKGKLEVPSDYDTCSKCSGTGNVGYNVDGGTCWECNGFGYKKN